MTIEHVSTVKILNSEQANVDNAVVICYVHLQFNLSCFSSRRRHSETLQN